MLSIACHPILDRQNAKVRGADLESKRVLLLLYLSWFAEAPLIAVQDFGPEGQPIKFCQLKEGDELKSVAVGPPGPVRWFAVLSLLAFVQIYDFASPTQPLISYKNSWWTEEYECHALSMSKTVLAIGKTDRSVELYDVLTGRRMRSMFEREWPQSPEGSEEEYVDWSCEYGCFNRNRQAPELREIHLHPYLPQGIVDSGMEIAAFNFNSDMK